MHEQPHIAICTVDNLISETTPLSWKQDDSPVLEKLSSIGLSFVGLSFNNCAQIADRNLDREIDRRQQESQENIPAGHGCDKSTRSRSLGSKEVNHTDHFTKEKYCTYHDEFVNSISIASNVICIEQKGTSQEPKRNDQSQKDDKKSNIGS